MTPRTVSLTKNGHTFVFRYPAGQEDLVVEEIMYLADDRAVDFDWIDAATLSFQVTELAARDCLGLSQADELAAE
jgi:hypothetical protein